VNSNGSSFTVVEQQAWANGCLYRRAITIDHTKVPNTNQADFPVLVSGTYAYLATTANGGNVTSGNGYDILFASDANGANPLPFELESYSPTTGAVVYWVKLPTVSHTTDAVFYVFYGNSAISTNQSYKTNVWNSAYKGVWHLPNGTTLTANDSTSNGNNGTITNASAATGQIDGAVGLGPSEYIDVGNNPSLRITGNALTLEAWIKTSESNPSQYERILAKEVSGNADPYMVYGLWRTAGTNLVNFGRATGGSGTLAAVTTAASLSMGAWTHLVGTYDGSNLKIYLNGSLDSQTSATGNIVSTNQNMVIGADTAGGGENFNGIMDEVRISDSARSADWIATEYNNQSSPSTFYSVGSSSSGTISVAITALSPSSANANDTIVVHGVNFGSAQGGSTISLNGTVLTPLAWSDTDIQVMVPLGASSGYFSVTVDSETAVSPLFTITPLVTGWSDGDIGSVGLAGSSSYSNGAFTVSGAGVGIPNTYTSDAFHFVYKSLSGDGSIVARVVSTTGVYEAGVMIRETLSASSPHAMTTDFINSVYLFYRSTSGGANSDDSYGGATPPFWVKLVRSGNNFSGYTSPDGLNWYQAGTTHSITMASDVYIGLAVTSNNTAALGTAVFDNVSISSTSTPAPIITSVSATTGSIGSQVLISGSGFGSSQNASLVALNGVPVTINLWSDTAIIATIPSGATSGYMAVCVAPAMNTSNPVYFTVTSNPLPTPWLNQDIGLVGLAGNATYSSGTFTVQGAGVGIQTSYVVDGIHFVYQPLSGDGSIVARVATQSSSFDAGVMIRETLDPAAPNAETILFNGSNISMFYRTSSGGSTSNQSYGSGSAPTWVKLVRVGNSFSSYTSTNGSSWSQIGSSQTISMATNVYVGLLVASSNPASLATVTFDNVAVTLGTTPVVTGLTPNFGATSTSVTIIGSNFGASQGASTIKFNGTSASSVTSWSDTQIVASVPSSATPGSGPVTVTVSSVTSPANIMFNVIKPTISSLTPPAAQGGATITLTGAGFGSSQGTSMVQFNSVAAAIDSWSDTAVSVTVPLNATTGPVTLTEAGIASNGVTFTVSSPLTISGISPSYGPPGTTVTILGSGFGASQSNSSVSFYGASSTASSWSDTQIVTEVPTGASSGGVSIGVGGMYVTGQFFTRTFTVELTDSNGNATTYVSELLGGKWVPMSSLGSGCSSCTLRGSISYTYDTQGNQLSRTDELGHVTTYTYDANGNATSVTAPIASGTYATTLYTYNTMGQVLTTTDPLGLVTTNTYDSHGNLLSVTTPAPGGGVSASVTQFAYDSAGELTSITDPLSHVTSLAYTTEGLIHTITDAQSNVTTYAYDSRGNRTSVTDATSHATSFTYDSGNRLTGITYPDSTTSAFTYDNRGRRTSATDQNGKTTTYAYDDADRLTSVTDAASNVTSYSYDTESNVISITDANSHTTSFSYDAFGRVTQTTFPSGYVETYGYDSAGNLTSKTDRKSQQITYTYDQLHRLTQKSYPDSTTVNYTYDNDSRLTQVTDPTGTYQFTFDNMGRLTATTTSYAFLTGRTFTTSYGYDAASNRTGFTDPESGSTSYAYDTLNRLQTLTPPTAFTASGNFGFGYDALNRRTSLTRPNSVNTSYSYDNLSRLSSVTHAKSGTTLDGASYGLDYAGNRTSRTPQPSGTASNYAYDYIYQLTGVTQGGTTTESYSYDTVGNRTSSLSFGSYTTNSSNEMTARTGESYSYDNNGNTATKVDTTGTAQYFWDFENRMSSVTLPGSGGTVTFKYDPFGRRIYKSSSSGTSVFAYDGDNQVEETNAAGAVVARYELTQNIDEPLAMLRSSATSYFHADGLGSISSLSNAAGSIANTYTYDSFGKLTASTGSLVNPFRYTARESDTETGLYYYRARYYDPAPGRFLSEDPAMFGGGIDLYKYVLNSPTNFVDPRGLAPSCVPTTSGIVCSGDQSPLDFQKGVLHAIFPGSSPQGAGLLIPMPCDQVKKVLENSPHYHTGHFWDGNINGWLTINPFLFWDPLFHSGGSEWRSTFGLHFRMKYNGKCDKTCVLDEFHLDEHNPMFDPLGHVLHDLPKALGLG
jgi:RHS repeat-associated protein